ncbi:MAG: GNAT family N-acetyltransferase [Pyrinomonadaceae bacterium]|nr:GNAT family N-acetyltransferase [Pyrinomonadaceae bacterium]
MQDSQLVVNHQFDSQDIYNEQIEVLTYKIIINLEDIDDDLIKILAPESHCLINKNFSRIIEKSLDGSRVHYVVVSNNDKPVALIYLVNNQADLPILKYSKDKSLLKMKYAICGNPIITGDCGISAIDKRQRDQLLPQLLKILKQALKDLGISGVILRDMDAPDQIFTGNGFFHIPSEPAVGIDQVNRWKTFSEYLADMEGKYKKKITGARKKLEEQGIKVYVEKDVSSINDRLYELYIKVARSAPPTSEKFSLQTIPTFLTNLPRKFRTRELNNEFFNLFRDNFGNEFDVITLRTSDKIVGYTINLHSDNVYYSLFSGMEYDKNVSLIYRTLLSTKIERAIERGAREICFGRTGMLTKLELGAHTWNYQCYGFFVRPLLTPVNIFLRSVTKIIPPLEMPDRHVFKSENDGMKNWYDTNWRDFYNNPKLVKSYDAQLSVLRLVKGGSAFYKRCVSALKLTSDNKIIDLCCGTGNLTAVLATTIQPNGEVYGIDLSSQMIAQAKTKGPMPNLTFTIMDASKTDFPNEYFDVATIVAALHEMPLRKVVSILIEARRILKPGGRLLIGEHYIAESRMGKLIQKALFRIISERKERLTFKELQKEGLPKILSQTGFQLMGDQIMPGHLFQITTCIKPKK